MSPEAAFESAGAGRGDPSALAFATDPESEHALREGLAGYRDAQVWPGGFRAARTALGRNR